MNKWKVLGGAVAVLCVGVLGVTLLPATGQTGGQKFTLCEKDSNKDFEHDVDNPPKRFSSGDQFMFTEPEFNENGKKVGKLAGTGTVIKLYGDEDALVQFNVSINLDGGRIEIQASQRFSHFTDGHFAIIGGTGKYEGKSGTVTPRNRPCEGVSQKGDSLVVKFD